MSLFDDIDANVQIDFPVLLGNLKKACGLWFLTERSAVDRADEDTYTYSYNNITTTTVEVLHHGLRLTPDDAKMASSFVESPPARLSSQNISVASVVGFKKLVDDFEWVCRSAQIRDSFTADSLTQMRVGFASLNAIPTEASGRAQHIIDSFLRAWVLRNLRANCLSACLQVLVAEKEILDTYYKEDAFLRNESYSTALCICLSAVELNQYSLLSQIESKLYSPTSAMITAVSTTGAKHRRTNSHPIFSISPPRHAPVRMRIAVNHKQGDHNNRKHEMTDPHVHTADPQRLGNISTFRKTKSLPILHHKSYASLALSPAEKPRRRSKTMVGNVRTNLPYGTISIPKTASHIAETLNVSTSNSTNECCTYSNSITTTTDSSYSGSDSANSMLPSTSPQMQQSPCFPAKLSPGTPSVASSNTTTDCRIELINCDDIKIWTDQTYEEKQTQHDELQHQARITEPYAIPQSLEPQKQKTKSSSPIGSFLCSLFSTPPTYTHWSILNQSGSGCATSFTSNDVNGTTTMFPCNLVQNTDNSTLSSGGVFDAFLPIYGKKLRSRNSQSLFEDGVSTLNYTTSANESLKTTTVESGTKSAAATKQLTKCQQSLTDFLQTSQMSRNNTELEKENAHFRVSEAIISAIEHVKWANNTEPEKKWRRRKEAALQKTTTTATDCLAPQEAQHIIQRSKFEAESSHDEYNEHIPYAELGETCLDLLSAEVVGLSLISKFNDKHLPKVSELKWLVSEDDTPQQLLPMPDSTPTSNPDENVIRPLTRGTRYWAPPRQQIIFTDHLPRSRKELIHKQNNLCAGCGMRVSRQYMNSFRYCTYLGKYHCTGCHRNQISPIPAKILQAWDFKCYPVSVFSYRLLEQMYTYPLFYVPDLNPVLYINNKSLLSARKKRTLLRFVKDFIKACRFALREQVYFNSIPQHITNDEDIWSLSDFVDVHNKSMQRSIDQLIEKCEHHIFSCVLCTARGFHCEYCQKDQVIYPWLQKVFRCDRCGSCFHLSCWKLMSEICCRCQRIYKRAEIGIA